MRVWLESGEIWDEIAPRLEPVARPSASPPLHIFLVAGVSDRVAIFRDGICIGTEQVTAAARAILLQAMVDVDAPAAILHAGACGGMLIAGDSGAGKTTLCAALMARGVPYHCDDSAVLDQHFRVAAMPFSLALREGSWPLLIPKLPALRSKPVYHRWGTDVRFLPPQSLEGPTPVKALAFIQYEPSSQTQLQRLSVFEALLSLQNSGFWVEHTQQSIQRFLTWLATIPRYRFRYTDLEEAEVVAQQISGDRKCESSLQSGIKDFGARQE
jgi:hypothetical protein